MPVGVYKRTKDHGYNISKSLKKHHKKNPLSRCKEKSARWKGGITEDIKLYQRKRYWSMGKLSREEWKEKVKKEAKAWDRDWETLYLL